MSGEALPLPPVAGIAIRREAETDLPFLLQLYASTREREMALVPWDEAAKQAFVEMQFSAQRLHYRGAYPDGVFAIVEKDGAPAGRLYVNRSARELRVIDIAIAPSCRGAGIGSAIMAAVLASADADGLVVSIHVEHENPALGWYERMGFERVREVGLYFYMERRPVNAFTRAQAASARHAG